MNGWQGMEIVFFSYKGKTEAIADDPNIPPQGDGSAKPSQSDDFEGVCIFMTTTEAKHGKHLY